MQHKRDKDDRPITQKDLDDWGARDANELRQYAVEALEVYLERRRMLLDRRRHRQRRPADEYDMVRLPRLLWDMVVACAKDGMRKAQGRRGLRSTIKKIAGKNAVITFARKRKAELVASGTTATEAQLQAAEEAEAKFRPLGFNWKASSIHRWM
jgi:hypothetical protein